MHCIFVFISANPCSDTYLADTNGNVAPNTGVGTGDSTTNTCNAGYEIAGGGSDTLSLVCNVDGSLHSDHPLPTCTGK